MKQNPVTINVTKDSTKETPPKEEVNSMTKPTIIITAPINLNFCPVVILITSLLSFYQQSLSTPK